MSVPLATSRAGRQILFVLSASAQSPTAPSPICVSRAGPGFQFAGVGTIGPHQAQAPELFCQRRQQELCSVPVLPVGRRDHDQ